jgi:outer membrane lipoprotein-sorting protein
MKKTLFLFLLLILTLAVQADLQKLYQDVINYYQGINTFQSELIQENFWKEIDVNKTSRGMLYYNSENLLISYAEPDQQKLFVFSKDVLLYEPKTSQAVWMDKDNFTIKPVEILKQYWKKSKAEMISNSGKRIVLRLTNPEEQIDIELDDLFIRSVKITDNDANYVKYSFRSEKFNIALPQNIFTPQLPRDTNIIDNRIKGK